MGTIELLKANKSIAPHLGKDTTIISTAESFAVAEIAKHVSWHEAGKAGREMKDLLKSGYVKMAVINVLAYWSGEFNPDTTPKYVGTVVGKTCAVADERMGMEIVKALDNGESVFKVIFGASDSSIVHAGAYRTIVSGNGFVKTDGEIVSQ